ncbi:MAG: nuclear transport factor 2 family protein, partial [Actinomycetes bacterium]
MHNVTERFVEALHRIDADRDTDPMVELTAEDAELMKLDGNHVATGKAGAATFWQDYRNVFGD